MNCCRFDRIAWLYHILVRLSRRPAKYAHAIKLAAGENAKGRVLDVGGGTGIIAEKFVRSAKEIHLVDPSKGMLARVSPKKIKTRLGKARELLYEDNSFDLVYCVDAFHHFPNGEDEPEEAIEKSIQEMLRVLKPGGSLVIVEFDPERFRGKMLTFMENRIMRFGSRFFTREELAGLFKGGEGTSKTLDNVCYLFNWQK